MGRAEWIPSRLIRETDLPARQKPFDRNKQIEMNESSILTMELEPDMQPSPAVMDFTDPQLQKCYECNFTEDDSLSDEQRRVRALMAVHDLSQVLEGPDSSGVHETIWHLLLPKLRPALRRWYQRGADKNPTAVALRDHLSQMAEENL